VTALALTGRSSALSFYASAYLLFLYAPVLLIPLFSFNSGIYVAFPLKGFTLDWYRQMAGNGQLVAAFWASFRVAVAVAAISTILGLLAALALTRHTVPARNLVTGFILLPLVIPSLVLALALLVVVRRIFGLELSLVTVAAAHVMLCVPYAMLVLMARLEAFDPTLEDAAFDLGDSAWRTFRRVTLPLAWPAIVSSFLLCFSASFDEYVLAAFLSGNQATLPVFIFSELRFPQRLPSILALGSLILVGSIVLVVFSEWFRRRGVPERTGAR
jgi:spermidine/putrescine transport system permease protein